MLTDFDNIQSRYTELKGEWEQYKPVWEDIAHFVGIAVDMQNTDNKGKSSKSRDLDEYVDDPTAALSVNQAGDYTMGIMWGTGDRVLSIKPSRYVTELVDPAAIQDYYDFCTDQSLYHMNHASAGLSTSMKSYVYDQFSFGTSGVGAFKNNAFLDGVDDNAFVFRPYGIDNTVIDEGKSGQPEVVFSAYNWRVSRIIAEFAKTDGVFDVAKFDKLPKPIREAYNNKKYGEQFQIIFGVFPRDDFNPKLKGKRGTRYRGVWFLDDQNNGEIFLEEDFSERPIAIARAIKVRGEVYGRASGTLLLSTIRSVNFMVGTAIEIVEKMSKPSLGVFNNSIFGDSVFDTSPDSLVVFNSQMTEGSGGSAPVFPIHDVGDPSAILQFLVPYLNEKITTAFKVDALLDFNSAKDMTATESLQRYAIRGKSLSGFLLQQKNEFLVPLTNRCISILVDMGELGVNPIEDKPRAEQLISIGKSERVIPEAILQVMESGRPWFELEFNNELEKLTRTEAVQDLIQMIQAITAIAALYPDIIEAIDWYSLLADVNDNLDYNSKVMLSASEFKDKIAAMAKERQEMMAMQAQQVNAQTGKDNAQANKSNSEALNNVG